MYPAFILEKIVNQIKEMNAELDKPVRRIGHDEQLFHVVSGTLDLLAPGLIA